MADKDLPRLRANADWKKLSAAHQAQLVEYCRTGKPDTPDVREGDSVLLCDSLVKVDESVRETLLQKVKEESRRFPRLLGLSGTPGWERPRFSGGQAAGAEVALCQRRMIQVMSLLVDRRLAARTTERQTLLDNTIEWFIFMGLPIEFATTSDSSLMGEFVKGPPQRLVLYHQSLLKIGPDSVGDKKETLRKCAHEVNHACRRNVAETDDGTHMVDELFAYVTELIADGNVVTESQISETFRTLSAPPYNLRKIIEGSVGQSYKKGIKYQGNSELPSANMLAYPLPSPGTANAGWHHTNAVPGLT